MFPLIPALILLLLHGPSSFERLAEHGRLPSSLLAFQTEAVTARHRANVDREESSRRVLASLIAATGDRALSEAFRAMFDAPASDGSAGPQAKLTEPTANPIAEPAPPWRRLPEGFSPGDRSRDGPF